MGMTKYCLVLAVLALSSCAGAQLEKEMKDSRGYSESDMAEIHALAHEYSTSYQYAGMQANRFQSNAQDRVFNDMKAIICRCFREIKSKCREKSDGLTPEQHALWVKSNAADIAILSGHSAIDPGAAPKIDPDTCG